MVTGVVGVEGSTSCSKRGERTESVNECARSPAVKIGGTVGDASGDGQCDHKPARFATYNLAVTEHTVGELPELAFRSFFSSEDSLHGGGREWRHAVCVVSASCGVSNSSCSALGLPYSAPNLRRITSYLNRIWLTSYLNIK